jgi:hypothetical protein
MHLRISYRPTHCDWDFIQLFLQFIPAPGNARIIPVHLTKFACVKFGHAPPEIALVPHNLPSEALIRHLLFPIFHLLLCPYIFVKYKQEYNITLFGAKQKYVNYRMSPAYLVVLVRFFCATATACSLCEYSSNAWLHAVSSLDILI